MSKRTGNLLVGIYFHPEAYPPTLNAVGELSECFDKITIVYRPHLKESWKYPANVEMIPSGKYMEMRKQKEVSYIRKLILFFNYLLNFYNQCIKDRPSYILVYDSISLFAYHLLRPVLFFDHKIWYHNHDVLERSQLRRYSIGYFAAKAEMKAFKYLDVFSLPSNDRRKFFPLDTFKGRYFFIPNFPSKKFYCQFYKPRRLEQKVKIIFQGQLAPQRGIEEIIPLLAENFDERQLTLGIFGRCDEEYKSEIIKLAESYHVTGKVHFDLLPYVKLPEQSASHHIGIALLAQSNIMTETIGTASNKIYEYAAVGLPVIYYNSEHLKRHLGEFKWAIPADLDKESIRRAIVNIISQYDDLCREAHLDFLSELNFEKGFASVKEHLAGAKKETLEVA